MSHAVDGAEAEDEVAAIDVYDFAIRKMFGDDVECHAIVGVVENRNEDKFVADIEIGVAGGEALTVEIDRRRHGKFFDAERLAVLVFHLF